MSRVTDSLSNTSAQELAGRIEYWLGRHLDRSFAHPSQIQVGRAALSELVRRLEAVTQDRNILADSDRKLTAALEAAEKERDEALRVGRAQRLYAAERRAEAAEARVAELETALEQIRSLAMHNAERHTGFVHIGRIAALAASSSAEKKGE